MKMSLPALQDKEASPLRLRQIFGGRYLWLLLLYSVLLLSITGIIAARRHLWWDEIEVYYVVILPNLKAVWHALLSGVDLQPPTYYLPLYYLVKWFGASSFVLRSIAIIPYWLATLVLYVIVARRTTALYGFVAMLFPSLTLAFSYAFEARPYGLVLLFTACAFLFWQLTHEKQYRRFALPALALSVGADFAVHYIACLVALPLLTGEAILAVRRRAFDFAVFLALCCGALPAIFLLPHILALGHFPAPISNPGLAGVYNALFFRPVLLSFVISAALAVRLALAREIHSDRKGSVNEFQTLPLAVAGTFLLVPCTYYPISYVTHVYYPRYVLETVIGAAIFLALLLHGARLTFPHLASALLVIFIAIVALDMVKRLRAPDDLGWGTFAEYAELFNPGTKELTASQDPIVLGPGAYLVVLRYGDPHLVRRSFYLLPNSHWSAAGAFLFQRDYYTAFETALPGRMQIADYESFIHRYHHFQIYEPWPWLLNRLLADGQDLKIQAFLEHGPLYSVVVK